MAKGTGFFGRLFRGDKGTPPELDYAALTERARNSLAALTEAANETWHMGKSEWDVDLDIGEIRFTHDGVVAVAPVQVIGTWNAADATWLWGWDHPSVPEPCARDAKKVLEYGKRHGIEELITRKIVCDEEKCWNFTAIARELSQAQCGYRGPSGKTHVYMTFGTVTLSRPAGAK